MKKQKFAICDPEAGYACKLMNYITQRKQIPFEILAFSGVESLVRFAQENEIELLLISSRMMCEKVRELNIAGTVILSDGEITREYQDYPTVYKYQASDSLVAEVMEHYVSSGTVSSQLFMKRTADVIGVFSPVGRCGKTCFALTLGQILARNRSVLYLNLESFAGFEELMGKEFTADISDVMYFVRQDRGNAIFKINAILQHLGKLDYVPPAYSSEDLQEVTQEEWLKMLDEVTSAGGYQTVILDMGGSVQERLGLLSACSRIYSPVCKGTCSEAKIRQYEKLLEDMDGGDILEKTSYLMLPFAEPDGEGEYFFERLTEGEMGDYVRDLLQNEGMEHEQRTV